MNHLDDFKIIEQVLEGRQEAYAILIERYEQLVFTLALRMLKNREDAEEAAQDVFVKAFKALSKFKGESKFSTWIYRITYNKCLDMLARIKRQPAAADIEELTHMNLGEVETIVDKMELEERNAQIKKCIERLPEDEAFLITVYYFEDKSVNELVEIMGLTESNIKIKLYRARKRLFTMLNQILSDEKKRTYGEI